MIVNQQALRGIYTSFKTIYAKAFEESKPTWERIATKVPSESGEESYKWLGQIPRMREWVGERQIQNLSAYDYTIKNKDFELTVAVERNDIADDRIGLYAPMVQNIGRSAATFPDDLVFGLLKDGFANKCFDGKPFFSENHVVGKDKVKITFSNKGTAKLTAESYAAARAAIMSLTDDSGKSLKLVPDLLVVPPALETKAREILVADQVNGTTNIYKGTAEPFVVPDLAGADEAWYLLCTSMPLKPLIFQEREAPRFQAFDKPDDPNVFMNKKFIYGSEARANAGYGFWQMAYGSDGSANA